METNNEWYYSELLKFLKEKEQEKNESYYQPMQLELPFEKYDIPTIQEEKREDRGVLVIDLLPCHK